MRTMSHNPNSYFICPLTCTHAFIQMPCVYTHTHTHTHTHIHAHAGRKEMTKFQKESGKGDEAGGKSAFSRGFCSVLNFVTALTRDLFVGPPTDLQNCLSAFFDTSVLKGKYTALPLSN